MKKPMDKLTAIRICINNDWKAIKELEYHLEKLYMFEAEELERIKQIEKELEEDFPL